MSLEADEAGGRLSGRKRPPGLPSSSQLNSRSLCGRQIQVEFRRLRRRVPGSHVWGPFPRRGMSLVGTRALWACRLLRPLVGGEPRESSCPEPVDAACRNACSATWASPALPATGGALGGRGRSLV